MSLDNEYEARKAAIAKDFSAELSKSTGNDEAAFLFRGRQQTSQLTKAAQLPAGSIQPLDGPAWAERMKQMLADALALGREMDEANFARDPHVGLAVELAYQTLKDKNAGLPAFVAELLEIAVRNAKDLPGYEKDGQGTTYFTDTNAALADPSWSHTKRQKAAVIAGLIKTVRDQGYANEFQLAEAKEGRSTARQAWKTIEPRAAFWDRPGNGSLSKFAGMSPEQIRQNAADNAARIERECAESLVKIAGGSAGERIDREGRRRVNFNGNEYVEVILDGSSGKGTSGSKIVATPNGGWKVIEY